MPNSSFPRDFGEGSTTNKPMANHMFFFPEIPSEWLIVHGYVSCTKLAPHLPTSKNSPIFLLNASSQRWLLPKAPMQQAAVTTSACSFCCIASCQRVMATMLLTHPVMPHQHTCRWLTQDEDMHLVSYPVSVYLYPNVDAIAYSNYICA